jgi:hypothetical protein
MAWLSVMKHASGYSKAVSKLVQVKDWVAEPETEMDPGQEAPDGINN